MGEAKLANVTGRPILVTGCGRSGASMIAGVFKICGAFSGALDGEDKNFENLRIRNEVVRPYLQSISADIACQYPLPNPKKMPIPADWAEKVSDCLRQDGYRDDSHWMYKSSSSSLIWPVWHYAFPDAKWVIVRRRTGDIVKSCLKTDFMRAFRSVQNQRAVGAKDIVSGWKWWVHQFEQRFVEMITEGLNCKVIWPERMVYGDYQQMFDTIDWLGLKWRSEVLAFIDPKLWRARQNTMPGHPSKKPVTEPKGSSEGDDMGSMDPTASQA